MKKKHVIIFLFLTLPSFLFIFAIIKKDRSLYDGKTALEWMDQLKMPANSPESDPSLKALKSMGASAVTILQKGMNSRQTSHRFKAAWALGELGPSASNAVPQLIKAVDDENVGVQINAMRALTSLGVVDKTLPPKLSPRLNDSNLEMSGCAGALLSLHAEKSKDPAYVQMFLNASSPRTRLMSLPLLVDPPKDSQLRSAAFGALLNDTNGWVREETVKFLKKRGLNETNLISSSRAANLATMQF